MTNKTKVNIELMLEEGKPETIDRGPGRVQYQPTPLELKIEDAINCIEADYKKEAAIRFLRTVYQKLESVKRPTPKCQALQELLKAALSDYGHYHISEEL